MAVEKWFVISEAGKLRGVRLVCDQCGRQAGAATTMAQAVYIALCRGWQLDSQENENALCHKCAAEQPEADVEEPRRDFVAYRIGGGMVLATEEVRAGCNFKANEINAALDGINVVMQDILGQEARPQDVEDIKETGGAIGLLETRLIFALRACELVLVNAKHIRTRLGMEAGG